jgi:hypothetical protein
MSKSKSVIGTVPQTFDKVDIVLAMKLFEAKVDGLDELGNDKVVLSEHTLTDFSDFYGGKVTVQTLTQMSNYRNLTFVLREKQTKDGKLINRSSSKYFSDVKYFATTKKEALKGLKKKLKDDSEKNNRQRYKRVDDEFRWAMERADRAEQQIQKEVFDLHGTLHQIELEIRKV